MRCAARRITSPSSEILRNGRQSSSPSRHMSESGVMSPDWTLAKSSERVSGPTGRSRTPAYQPVSAALRIAEVLGARGCAVRAPAEGRDGGEEEYAVRAPEGCNCGEFRTLLTPVFVDCPVALALLNAGPVVVAALARARGAGGAGGGTERCGSPTPLCAALRPPWSSAVCGARSSITLSHFLQR